METEYKGAQRPGRRKRQWADIYEVKEESDREGKLLCLTETWKYHDHRPKQQEPWPTKRDMLNALIGAAAILVLCMIGRWPL